MKQINDAYQSIDTIEIFDILSALKLLRFLRLTTQVSVSSNYWYFATASTLKELFGLMFAPQTLGLSLPASPAVFKVNLFKSLVIAPTLLLLYQKKIKGNKFPRSFPSQRL
jgi:hypothetical protein